MDERDPHTPGDDGEAEPLSGEAPALRISDGTAEQLAGLDPAAEPAPDGPGATPGEGDVDP